MKTSNINTIERGILTSAYKQEIRRNIAISKSASLSKIKYLLYRQSNLVSQTGTILQVSVFAFAIILIAS
jgi:hypothetical protein